MSKVNTIASKALRHNPNNNTVPSQKYTIEILEGEDNLMIKQNHFASSMKTDHIER